MSNLKWPDDFLNRVICGDCLEVMKGIPDGAVDLVVTDPPYGIQHSSHGQIFKDSDPIMGDADQSLSIAVRLWASTRKIPCAMFFSPYKPLTCWRNVLVWSKGVHVGGGGDIETCWKRDIELIGVENNRPLLGKRDSSVLSFNAVSPPPSGHFCEKPIALMRYLISKLDGNTILDPFAGSGTTLVAAKQLGRKYIGIEINPDFCKIAEQRLAQEELFG